MNKELILFIAYGACSGTDIGLWKKNPFQYRNALNLISINFFIHVVQLLLLVSNFNFLYNGQIRPVCLLLFIGGLLTIMFLMNLIFPRRMLANAIKQYKGSRLQDNSKLIGFGYFVFNISVMVLIGLWRH
jgi:hypothetical protein